MSLKPTRRRNGTDMVTIRTEHTLSFETVAICVMTGAVDLDALTKAEVEDLVRWKLVLRGSEWMDYWRDNNDYDDLDAAKDALRRLYPDWKDQP